MLGSHRLGSKAGVAELVGLALEEPDGEGANRLIHHPRHQGGQTARIDSAGEKKPERDVTHQVTLDNRLEPRPKVARPFVEGGWGTVGHSW